MRDTYSFLAQQPAASACKEAGLLFYVINENDREWLAQLARNEQIPIGFILLSLLNIFLFFFFLVLFG